MKRISPDKTHIDYTIDNEGIRVWKNRFRRIYKDFMAGEWLGKHSEYRIPANDKTIRGKFVPLWEGQAPPQAAHIAMFVGRYTQEEADPELEQVLLGIKTFEEAASE
jgi:hypothetical protein